MQLKKYSRTSDAPMWQKLLGFVVACAVCFFIIKGFFLYMDYDFKQKRDEILANPVYIKGVIVDKSSYKGVGAKMEYVVNNKKYKLNTGTTYEFYEKYKVGDSVGIVYSRRNPSVSLLEYKLKPSE